MRYLLLFTLAVALQAQTVFVVRHAERTGEPDPPLNADGQRRAEALSRMLADAGVKTFIASEALRAQQTALPTARRANREVEVLRDKAIDEITARARAATTPADATLVVGHRSTVPLIVKALGGGEIPELGSAEHDRLLVVSLLPNGGATVTTLRFEAPAQ